MSEAPAPGGFLALRDTLLDVTERLQAVAANLDSAEAVKADLNHARFLDITVIALEVARCNLEAALAVAHVARVEARRDLAEALAKLDEGAAQPSPVVIQGPWGRRSA